MRRDNGNIIALAAAAALAGAAIFSQSRRGARNDGDEASESGKKPKFEVSEQRRKRGLLQRALRNAADQANGDTISISNLARETSHNEEELREVANELVKTFGYYWLGDSRDLFGKVSEVRKEVISMLRKAKSPEDAEVAVRAADLIARRFPNAGNYDAYAMDVSRRELENDMLVYAESMGLPEPTQDERMPMYANLFAEMLKKNEFFKNHNDRTGNNLNYDALASRWDYAFSIPFIQRVVRDAIRESNVEIGPSAALQRFEGKYSDLMDWAANVPGVRGRLARMTLEEAQEESDRWHQEAQEELDRVKIERLKRQGKWFDCPNGIHPISNSEVVHRHDNGSGFYWVRLKTGDEIKNEGNLTKGYGCLRHCIGEWDGYIRSAENGSQRHYSLRTPSNRPVLTVTFNVDSNGNPGQTEQLKGYMNRNAGDGISGGQMVRVKDVTLKDTIYKDLTPEQYLDEEALMVADFYNSMRANRSGSELSRVNSRLAEIERKKKEAKKLEGSSNNWRKYRRSIATESGYARTKSRQGKTGKRR